MTELTVEVYGEPVADDSQWAAWRSATDVVPGTILLEDPDEPCLIFPIDASSVADATVMVHGVMAALKLGIAWGRAYVTEPGNHVHTPGSTIVTPDFVPSWVEAEADTRRHRSAVPLDR